MSPSGLIFLVIVGIWAAYFTQYWIRRREHLSTARSMDRFSESMRVLARRSPLPESSLTAPAAPTYALAPGRSARPQILIKRAEMSSAGPTSRDEEGNERATGPVFSSPVIGGPSSGVTLGSSSGRRGDGRSGGGRSADGRSGDGRRGDGRSGVAAGGTGSLHRPVRALLGVTLLAALVATVVIAALAPFTRLLWWAFVVPFLVAVVAAAGLRAVASVARHQARADHTATSSTPVRRSAGHRPTDPETSASHARATHAGPDAPSSSTSSIAEGEDARVPTSSGHGTATADRDAVHDQDAPGPATAAVAMADLAVDVERPPVPLVDEDDIPLTWEPIPVPRPTYTMKARAEYPAPPSADVTSTTPAEGYAHEDDDDVVDPWRVAGA